MPSPENQDPSFKATPAKMSARSRGAKGSSPGESHFALMRLPRGFSHMFSLLEAESFASFDPESQFKIIGAACHLLKGLKNKGENLQLEQQLTKRIADRFGELLLLDMQDNFQELEQAARAAQGIEALQHPLRLPIIFCTSSLLYGSQTQRPSGETKRTASALLALIDTKDQRTSGPCPVLRELVFGEEVELRELALTRVSKTAYTISSGMLGGLSHREIEMQGTAVEQRILAHHVLEDPDDRAKIIDFLISFPENFPKLDNERIAKYAAFCLGAKGAASNADIHALQAYEDLNPSSKNDYWIPAEQSAFYSLLAKAGRDVAKTLKPLIERRARHLDIRAPEQALLEIIGFDSQEALEHVRLLVRSTNPCASFDTGDYAAASCSWSAFLEHLQESNITPQTRQIAAEFLQANVLTLRTEALDDMNQMDFPIRFFAETLLQRMHSDLLQIDHVFMESDLWGRTFEDTEWQDSNGGAALAEEETAPTAIGDWDEYRESFAETLLEMLGEEEFVEGIRACVYDYAVKFATLDGDELPPSLQLPVTAISDRLNEIFEAQREDRRLAD